MILLSANICMELNLVILTGRKINQTMASTLLMNSFKLILRKNPLIFLCVWLYSSVADYFCLIRCKFPQCCRYNSKVQRFAKGNPLSNPFISYQYNPVGLFPELPKWFGLSFAWWKCFEPTIPENKQYEGNSCRTH